MTEIVLPPRDGSVRDVPAAPPLLRIVCWQLAIVVGLLATVRPWPQAAVLGGAAALLLAASAVRVGGRWLSTLLVRRIRLLLRSRSRRDLSTSPGGPAAALLALLAPGARTTTLDVAGAPAGVLSRPEEVVTVLRPADGLPRAFVRAALAGAMLPEPDPATPDLRLQLVLHRGPQHVGAPAAEPRAWLAVRALRDIDVALDDDLRVALSNSVRRVQRRFRTPGPGVTVLAEQELLATVTGLAHCGSGRTTVREQWRCWRAGRIVQAGVRLGLGSLPAAQRSAVLERLFAAVPDVAVTAAVTVDGTEPAAVLRIAAPADPAVDAAIRGLTRLTPQLGVRLERLDGLHGRAVAASVPIGGEPL